MEKVKLTLFDERYIEEATGPTRVGCTVFKSPT